MMCLALNLKIWTESKYQFHFLGYKVVVVVHHQLKGIKMRLRDSHHKFPVRNNGQG